METVFFFCLLGLAVYWCCCSDGGCCNSGTSPIDVDIEFDNVVDGTCADCDQGAPNGYNNATYTLTQNFSQCAWTGTGECGQLIYLNVVDGGAGYHWQLTIYESDDTTLVALFKGAPSTPYLDCSQDETGIAVVNGIGDDTECDWHAGPNATVDILPQ